jgi:hypothetical protein
MGQIQEGRVVEHPKPHPAVGVEEAGRHAAGRQRQPAAKWWGIGIMSPYSLVSEMDGVYDIVEAGIANMQEEEREMDAAIKHAVDRDRS